MDGGRREAEDGKVDHKESSDDEEVELRNFTQEGCRRDRSAGGRHPGYAGVVGRSARRMVV